MEGVNKFTTNVLEMPQHKGPRGKCVCTTVWFPYHLSFVKTEKTLLLSVGGDLPYRGLTLGLTSRFDKISARAKDNEVRSEKETDTGPAK